MNRIHVRVKEEMEKEAEKVVEVRTCWEMKDTVSIHDGGEEAEERGNVAAVRVNTGRRLTGARQLRTGGRKGQVAARGIGRSSRGRGLRVEGRELGDRQQRSGERRRGPDLDRQDAYLLH